MGTFLPRPKKIDGQEFDIANLDYDELPEAYKFENREAARVACESVREQIGESSNIRASHAVLDDEFVTKAAIAQHDAWVERNSGRADPSLCIPRLPTHMARLCHRRLLLLKTLYPGEPTKRSSRASECFLPRLSRPHINLTTILKGLFVILGVVAVPTPPHPTPHTTQRRGHPLVGKEKMNIK